VMVFPSTFVYLPLVENAEAASICARAYNDWVYEYCSADPKRLYPAAILPVQNPDCAIAELRRIAKLGFKAGLVRPIFSGTRYPTLPEYDPLWEEFETLGIVLGMHTFPSRGEGRCRRSWISAWERTENGCSATRRFWSTRLGSL